MKFFNLLCFCLFLYGCNSEKKQALDLQLKFLDEYVIPNELMVDSTLVGGLSGIDYHNGSYYIVCDDSQDPRFYIAKIIVDDAKLMTVSIDSLVRVSAPDKTLDLESIIIEKQTNDVLLVSEGNIRKGKDPSFIKVNANGGLLIDYEIPQYFKAKGAQEPRHNGVFEGLTSSFDTKGYWIATELPLKKDGPKPKYTETTSPVRMTYVDQNGSATKQFAYLLDRIEKKPLGEFGVNGVTDVLAYAEHKLFVIERSYSSGYGNQGNVIKIYSVDYSNAKNTLDLKQLSRTNYKPITKELVFNFESIRDSLTNRSIDNIEGLCFGPTLENGNKSLLFIADNDFNKQGNRQTQLILMELIDQKSK